MAVSRRDFTRLFAIGGSAALFADPAWARQAPSATPLAAGGPAAGEAFWTSVRAQFVMPPDLGVINAANLCPAPRAVAEVLARESRSVDMDPSPQNRARLYPEKEKTRGAVAEFLRVTPEEIVLTRNTSEANNLVSSGVDLKAGDEVVIHADNHPSNHQAWREKAKRFGYSVVIVEQKNPHPGAEYYIDAFTKAITPRTKVIAFTQMTSSVGDMLPARELCRLARERGILSLMDGAQSFGLFDLEPPRDPARLLQRQRAQVAVRRARVRRALHQQERAGQDLAVDLQRLHRHRRHLAHLRGIRPA